MYCMYKQVDINSHLTRKKIPRKLQTLTCGFNTVLLLSVFDLMQGVPNVENALCCSILADLEDSQIYH